MDIGFGTYTGTGVGSSTSTWTSSVSGTLRGNPTPIPVKAAGFRTVDPLASTGAGPWYGVGNEAQTAVTLTATKTDPVNLVAGCPYFLTLNASYYQGQGQITLAVTVGSQTVYTFTPPVGSPSAGGSLGGQNMARTSASFTVASTGSYAVGLTMSLPQVGSSGGSNDLYIRNLLITCG